MSRRPVKQKNDAAFLAAVTEAGGEVLAPTNPYEVMRFKTKFGVGVVYENARGARNWNDAAKRAKEHVTAKTPGSLAVVVIHGRRKGAGTVNRLIDRDGEDCFFCHNPLAGDITTEHLVNICHGGPNHISNLFLAHKDCNANAGHLSAPEKIRIRENAPLPSASQSRSPVTRPHRFPARKASGHNKPAVEGAGGGVTL